MADLKTLSPSVQALMSAKCGHRVTRDGDGNSIVELSLRDGRTVTVVRPTFDEAVFAAFAEAGDAAGNPFRSYSRAGGRG